MSSLPFSYPPPPNIPSIQIIKNFPFTYSGVSYIHQFHVKDIYSKSRIYNSFDTCALLNDLHLDLVTDWYWGTSIQALSKLFCYCGIVKLTLSDNGSKFVSSEPPNLIDLKVVTWEVQYYPGVAYLNDLFVSSIDVWRWYYITLDLITNSHLHF